MAGSKLEPASATESVAGESCWWSELVVAMVPRHAHVNSLRPPQVLERAELGTFREGDCGDRDRGDRKYAPTCS